MYEGSCVLELVRVRVRVYEGSCVLELVRVRVRVYEGSLVPRPFINLKKNGLATYPSSNC